MITMDDISAAELRRWTERYEQHLDQVPVIIEHLRAAAVPASVRTISNDRISGGGGAAPAPIRLEPVDAVDDLWAALAEYALDVAHRLQEQAPLAAGDTWTARGSIQGIPARLDADGAYRAAWGIVAWLTDRGPRIHPLELADSEQHLFGLIRGALARWIDSPPIERPAHKRRCSVCGEKAVLVAWILGDTGEAECRVCGATYAREATVRAIGPDCRDGKHAACDGRALDEATDTITVCDCTCHTEAVAA